MKKLLVLLSVIALVSVGGCYYDNMEDVYPGNGLFEECDTTGVTTYSGNISTIIDNNCIACHSGAGANADVHLDSYEGVRDAANSGQLVGATWHEQGYTPMPPNYQLDSCSLVHIKKWVLAGAPNN
jgi:hypothetical protein